MDIITRHLVLLFIGCCLCDFSVFSAPMPVPSPPAPKDSWLVLTLHDSKYACVYMDVNDNNIAKLYRGHQWSQYCDFVRYDQFSRLSIRKNGKEYCLTTPTSVTSGKETWDYLRFTPCVVGLYRQLWVQQEEDGKSYIVSSSDQWRVLDYEWKLFISSNGATYFKHYLAKDRSDMKAMLNTAARPTTYTIPLSLQWGYDGKIYELFNEPTHYNPSTRQILNAKGQCLKSNLDATDKGAWSYTSFEKCPEKCSAQFTWNINLTSKNNKQAKYQLWDSNGNMLVVADYGVGSSYPFAASAVYVVKSKVTWLTTEFDSILFYKDAYRQYRKNNAAAGDICNLTPDRPFKLVRSPNPYNLVSEPWLMRWWEIARSTDSAVQEVGYCGVCMLQVMEMISEYVVSRFTYRDLPPMSATFMFVNNPASDPFEHLRSHYTILSAELTEIRADIERQIQAQAQQIVTHEQSHAYFTSSMERTTAAFFPQLEMTSTSVFSPPEHPEYWNNLNTRPVGTVWGVFYTIYEPATETEPEVMLRHAVLLYRGRNGFYVMRTNTTDNFQDYRDEVATPITTAEDFHQRLLDNLDDHIDLTRPNFFHGIVLAEVGQRIRDSSITRAVSFRNCAGAGPGRRGNGNSTRASDLNACATEGRCLLE